MQLRSLKIFSEEWFNYWQRFLLPMINFPVKSIREEIRLKLGIPLDRNILVYRIYPHAFSVRIGFNEFQMTFFTTNIFADNLHKEWLGLWRLIHKWDMNFANRFAPRLNLGFDSLTIYGKSPDGTSGMCEYNGVGGDYHNQVWSDMRNSSVGSYSTMTTSERFAALIHNAATTNRWDWLQRGFLSFNTAPLTGGATVTSAIVSVYGTAGYNIGFSTTADLVLAGCTLASPTSLTDNDFSSIDRTALNSITLAGWTSSGYNAFSSNTAMINRINKNGNTEYSAQLSWDINDAPPTWGSGFKSMTYQINFGDVAGKEPKLDVVYTVVPNPIPTNIQNIMTQIRM